MNKLLLAVITLAAGLTAVAQGTLGNVNINNNFTAPGASAKAFITTALGAAPLPKALGRVEVLDSTGAVISSVKDGTGNLFGADGLFFLGVTDIPGSAPAGGGTITIRAWDVSSGSTYATAVLKNSAVVTLTALGGGLTPTPQLGVSGNFTGFDVGVPEPSTVALAALGVAGLFFVARRK